MALDFYDNGTLSSPNCAECKGGIHVEDNQWKHNHYLDKIPPFWGKLADEEESGESQTGLGSFFSDVRSNADGKFKDTQHQAVPHDGRTIAQQNASDELLQYELASRPEEASYYAPKSLEGKDIEPKLFAHNVGKQMKKYVPPPPNKWGPRGPGRSE
jgi:hypothetical protein